MSAINTPFRTRLRVCRSFFLTPGSRPDTFVAGHSAGWDTIIVNLESTVAPEDKEQARGKRADLVAPASANGLCAHRSNKQSASAEGLRGFMPRGLLRALCSPTIFTLLLAGGELRAFLPVLLLRLIVVVAREGIAWR